MALTYFNEKNMISKINIFTIRELFKSNTMLNIWRGMTERHGDIYYHLEYLRITQSLEGGEILIALFNHSKGDILYPFVLRPIPVPIEGSETRPKLYDICTPFEYGGPLYVGDDQNRHLVQREFMHEFNIFCSKKMIVSEFVRFHPLLSNQFGWEQWYDIQASCSNVTIELAQEDDEIFRNFRNNHRRNLKRAERNDCVVERVNATPEALNNFRELYLRAMKQLNAKPYYYFPREYFTGLSELGDKNVFLYVIKDRLGDYACSGLFIGARFFCHYHLGAMTKEAREHRSGSLLFYKAAIGLKRAGFNFLHLGGAAASQAGLMQFKEGFSKTRVAYCTGSRIHRNLEYDMLCKVRPPLNGPKTALKFFPAYRS